LTPGREIVVTAPTGQRHETWFNALSYLLLRTEQERNVADDTINEEELDEFAPPNPGSFSFRRSVSRMTGRSAARSQVRRSLSSYHSRSRPSSPTKSAHNPSPSHELHPHSHSHVPRQLWIHARPHVFLHPQVPHRKPTRFLQLCPTTRRSKLSQPPLGPHRRHHRRRRPQRQHLQRLCSGRQRRGPACCH
jgi:hypothetical protein